MVIDLVQGVLARHLGNVLPLLLVRAVILGLIALLASCRVIDFLPLSKQQVHNQPFNKGNAIHQYSAMYD